MLCKGKLIKKLYAYPLLRRHIILISFIPNENFSRKVFSEGEKTHWITKKCKLKTSCTEEYRKAPKKPICYTVPPQLFHPQKLSLLKIIDSFFMAYF